MRVRAGAVRTLALTNYRALGSEEFQGRDDRARTGSWVSGSMSGWLKNRVTKVTAAPSRTALMNPAG